VRGQWKRTLRDAERELQRLEQQRDGLDREILRLRRSVHWLRAAEPRPSKASNTALRRADLPPQSLTNACRAALRVASPHAITPRAVKQLLTESGFGWDRFLNPMSSVHTVLKRLVEQGEASAVAGGDGIRRFIWRTPLPARRQRTQAEHGLLLDQLVDGTMSLRAVVATLKRTGIDVPR
jgi:hypothetical protein